MDLAKVLDASVLDDSTLRELVDAASNPDIARALNTEWFLEAVAEVEKNVVSGRRTRYLARQLLHRIHGLNVFEDAISNTQGDFSRAAETLKSSVGNHLEF